MMKVDNIEIQVTNSEKEKLTLSVAFDSNTEDYRNYFRTILTWLTFTENGINDVIKEEDD